MSNWAVLMALYEFRLSGDAGGLHLQYMQSCASDAEALGVVRQIAFRKPLPAMRLQIWRDEQCVFDGDVNASLSRSAMRLVA